MKLSIVSPVYQAEEIIDTLVERIIIEASKITSEFEIILVEDGGSDGSWKKIEKNCLSDYRIKGIKLSRNFGQHNAITAGLEASRGDFVIVMDCDLQDNPKYFPQLLEKALEGNDIVFTIKEERKHSFIKNLIAGLFYKVFNFLVHNTISKGSKNIGAYSLLSRAAVEAYKKVGDYRRHYLMVVRWLGFKYDFINIEHEDRFEGNSSYTLAKLITHALNGITSQSVRLLNLTAYFGLVLSLISFISALVIVIRYTIQPFQVGWASIFVLILFIGGLIILSIGICGIYIGQMFEQTQNRPLYIIEKKLN